MRAKSGTAGTVQTGDVDAAAVLAALPSSADAAVVRDGPRTVVATGLSEVRTGGLEVLNGLAEGFWAGWLPYEAGFDVEHVVRRAPAAPDPVTLGRFEARAVFDGTRAVRLVGSGPGRDLLERALSQ